MAAFVSSISVPVRLSLRSPVCSHSTSSKPRAASNAKSLRESLFFGASSLESSPVTTVNNAAVLLSMSLDGAEVEAEAELDFTSDMPDDEGDMGPEPTGGNQMDEPQDRMTEETKLFVGNLAWGTTDSSLGAAFEEFGTVIDARVITDRFTGKSRGFGFIEYDNSGSAQKALTGMDGVEIDGRAVRVDRANQKSGGNRGGPPRGGGGGGMGGGRRYEKFDKYDKYDKY